MFKCFRENTFFPLRLVLVHSNPAINQIEKKNSNRNRNRTGAPGAAVLGD